MWLHYIHLNKNWYYFFSNSKYNKIFNSEKALVNKLIWLAGEDITKSGARKLLNEIFPNDTPIFTMLYHANPSIGGISEWYNRAYSK